MKSLPNNIIPYDGEAYYIPGYFSQKKSDILYDNILKQVTWRADKIQMFGKWYEQKRKVAWHGDKNITYIYSKIKMISPGWTKDLKKINDLLKKDFNLTFNSALVNFYRNGLDHMSYHSDNEKELGANPVIASLNFGTSRDFYFKHNKTKEVIKIILHHGDLLIMQGELQDYWKHALPKRQKIKTSRMNLTYRFIYQ